MRANSSVAIVWCLILLFNGAPARCDTIWDGSESDFWRIAGNWDTGVVPTASVDVLVGAPAPTIVETVNALARELEVSSTGEIEVQGGRSLTINGGLLTNNGLVTVNSDNSTSNSILAMPGGGTFDGSGEVVLAAPGNRAQLTSVGGTITQEADHTIRGEGSIVAALINNGTITAEDANGDSMATLTLATGSKTNNGVIQSSSSATLTIGVNVMQGASGTIIADASKVSLNPITITEGVLESANDGFFETAAGTIVFNQVHNMARLQVINASATTLRIEGSGIVNDGTIVISSDTAATASLTFGSTGEVSGSGEVILNREGLGARIVGAPSFVGTNGASHTIRGTGSIDATLVNDGTIIAEPRGTGTVLEFHDSNSDSTTTNNNVIRADAGGIVRLTNVRITQDNTNGRIVANEGTIEFGGNHLNDPLVAGGRFETIGAGSVEVASNTRIHDVTNEGQLNIQPGKALRLGGSSLTNNGSITFEAVNGPGFSSATMIISDNVTLDGDGEFVLTDTLGPAFHSVRVDTGFTLTQASQHTIRGEGIINCCGSFGTFINNGRIEGTSPTDDIEINGTLGGNGILKNVQIGGTHSPGESTAIVPLEGSYTIKNFGGTLGIEIGGTTPGTQYDQLMSTDSSNLITIGSAQTTLDVSLVDLGNSYVPAVGDRFTILSSPNNIVGEFADINLPTSGLGRSILWAPVDRSDPTKYVLEIAAVSGFSADFDHDGDVDSDDLDEWQGAYGVNALADADGDGDSDGRDFLEWQRQYGSGVGSLAASTTVPEPGTLGLLALAISCVAMSTKGHKRQRD